MSRHEDRFVQAIRVAAPMAAMEHEFSMPRKSRRLDLVCNLLEPPALFGVLRSVCARRVVHFEHESSRVTQRKVASAMLGQSWLVYRRLQRTGRASPSWLRSSSRPPITVVVAEHLSKHSRDIVPNLAPMGLPGVWATSDIAKGGTVLVSVRDLEPDTGTAFWAWSVGSRSAEQACARLNELLGDASIPTHEKGRVMEAIMDSRIEATQEESESVLDRVRRDELLALVREVAPAHLDRMARMRSLDELRKAIRELAAGQT